jgi:hypothetical protein
MWGDFGVICFSGARFWEYRIARHGTYSYIADVCVFLNACAQHIVCLT